MEENMDHEKFDQAFITAFDIDPKILGNDLKYESRSGIQLGIWH